METSKEEQRRAFVHDYESGQWSMTELCQRFGITRPTGYLWVARYEEEGEDGLVPKQAKIDEFAAHEKVAKATISVLAPLPFARCAGSIVVLFIGEAFLFVAIRWRSGWGSPRSGWQGDADLFPAAQKDIEPAVPPQQAIDRLASLSQDLRR
jgi:hypothetical protein